MRANCIYSALPRRGMQNSRLRKPRDCLRPHIASAMNCASAGLFNSVQQVCPDTPCRDLNFADAPGWRVCRERRGEVSAIHPDGISAGSRWSSPPGRTTPPEQSPQTGTDLRGITARAGLPTLTTLLASLLEHQRTRNLTKSGRSNQQTDSRRITHESRHGVSGHIGCGFAAVGTLRLVRLFLLRNACRR